MPANAYLEIPQDVLDCGFERCDFHGGSLLASNLRLAQEGREGVGEPPHLPGPPLSPRQSPSPGEEGAPLR